MSPYNLVRRRLKFTQFFLFNAELTIFDNAVYHLSISLSSLERYLRSNLKVVVKRTKFWTFFAFPNFKGGGAPKCRTCFNTPT